MQSDGNNKNLFHLKTFLDNIIMLDPIEINYQKLITDSTLPVAIRMLAAKLNITPMMLVGEYFKNISDEELQSLRQLTVDPDESMPELLLLTIMLTSAEGTSALEDDELYDHIKTTLVFITTSVLDRFNLVEAFYDKFSYGHEMLHEVIARPLFNNSEGDMYEN